MPSSEARPELVMSSKNGIAPLIIPEGPLAARAGNTKDLECGIALGPERVDGCLRVNLRRVEEREAVRLAAAQNQRQLGPAQNQRVDPSIRLHPVDDGQQSAERLVEELIAQELGHVLVVDVGLIGILGHDDLDASACEDVLLEGTSHLVTVASESWMPSAAGL